MTAEAHADAVRNLIGAAVRLYEGEAPDDAVLPYAVLHMSSTLAARDRLAPISEWRDAPFLITSAGLDDDGARSVAERVRTAVLDQRPVVPGRRSSPITQTVSEPLRLDRDVKPHRLYLVDGYRFSTTPTSA